MSLKTNRLKVTKTLNQEHPIQVSTDENLEFTNTYNEVKLYWFSGSRKNMISTKNNKNRDSPRTLIMGKVEGQGDHGTVHVTAVTVAPEFRRQQLAKKLMNLLEDISDKM
ncbi:N-terminal acetyltransferase B complex catalytic subunit NAA20 [Tanacetum coccineum]